MSYIPIKFRTANTGATPVAVKNGPGNLYGFNIVNPNASAIYVKLYDKLAASVNQASDHPVYTFLVNGGPGETFGRSINPELNFINAIAVACVTGFADTDTTGPATAPIIELDYY